MKTPLYHLIYCDLRSQIESLHLKAGDLLPPELELERIFNASRSPVRQALGLLENEGLIVRYPGKGTFVASPPEEIQLWFDSSPFRRHIQREWGKIHCKTISVSQELPPRPVQEFLLLGKKQKATYVERLRCVSGQPIIYVQHYLHPSLESSQISNAGDFYSFRAMLMEKFSVEITRIEDTLKAVAATSAVAGHLGVPEFTPLLAAQRSSFSGKTPLHFDVFYTLSELWDYHVTFEKGLAGSVSVATSR